MSRGGRAWMAGAVLVLASWAADPARASYGIYVGRNLTADGSVLLGGTGDEVSSHWLEIVPRAEWPVGARVRDRARDADGGCRAAPWSLLALDRS